MQGLGLQNQHIVQGLLISSQRNYHPKNRKFKTIIRIKNSIYYPPLGNRGVGYSKTNLYGVNLNDHFENQNEPLVAMIETKKGLDNLEEILECDKLDVILIGPYDLSASYDKPGEVESEFIAQKINYILNTCKKFEMPVGLHVVEPNLIYLKDTIKMGFNFIPYSIDTVFLREASKNPLIKKYNF